MSMSEKLHLIGSGTLAAILIASLVGGSLITLAAIVALGMNVSVIIVQLVDAICTAIRESGKGEK